MLRQPALPFPILGRHKRDLGIDADLARAHFVLTRDLVDEPGHPTRRPRRPALMGSPDEHRRIAGEFTRTQIVTAVGEGGTGSALKGRSLVVGGVGGAPRPHEAPDVAEHAGHLSAVVVGRVAVSAP